MTRKAYIPEENLFGIKTVVTDKSEQGLPNGISREPETNLPPGAATPNSVRKEDTADGNGRVLSSDSPSYNGPGTGEPGPFEHPRTTGLPGDMAGSPTKFDYNMVTRRTMTAYKPRTPWKRQRRQQVWDRLESKKDYKLNKAEANHRAKIWYKKVHRSRQFQKKREQRREDPAKYKRRRASGGEGMIAVGTLSAVRVATRYVKALGEIILYDQGRPSSHDQARMVERVILPHTPTPGGYEKPEESGVSAPASSAKIIPDSMKQASTSPDRVFKGLRTPEEDTDLALWGDFDGYSTVWFLGWWDYEWDSMGGVLGDDPGSNDPETNLAVRTALANGAELKQGRDRLHRLEWTSQRKAVKAAQEIIQEIQEYRARNNRKASSWREERDEDEDRRYFILKSDGGNYVFQYNWTWEGTEKPTGELVWTGGKYGDEIVAEDVDLNQAKRRAEEHEQERREEERTRAVQEKKERTLREQLLDFADDMRSLDSDQTHRYRLLMQQATELGLIDDKLRRKLNKHNKQIGDLRGGGTPDNELMAQGLEMIVRESKHEHLRTAATIAEIEQRVSSEVGQRARDVSVRLVRADQKNGIWTFKATGSQGKDYIVRFKAERKGNTKEVSKLQIRVSCDCDFFRFQGPEHMAKTQGYLYGKPRGTASAPTQKDPGGLNGLCKHAAAAINTARRYRVASNIEWVVDTGSDHTSR